MIRIIEQSCHWTRHIKKIGGRIVRQDQRKIETRKEKKKKDEWKIGIDKLYKKKRMKFPNWPGVGGPLRGKGRPLRSLLLQPTVIQVPSDNEQGTADEKQPHGTNGELDKSSMPSRNDAGCVPRWDRTMYLVEPSRHLYDRIWTWGKEAGTQSVAWNRTPEEVFIGVTACDCSTNLLMGPERSWAVRGFEEEFWSHVSTLPLLSTYVVPRMVLLIVPRGL